jgi:hypothetical protein
MDADNRTSGGVRVAGRINGAARASGELLPADSTDRATRAGREFARRQYQCHACDSGERQLCAVRDERYVDYDTTEIVAAAAIPTVLSSE